MAGIRPFHRIVRVVANRSREAPGAIRPADPYPRSNVSKIDLRLVPRKPAQKRRNPDVDQAANEWPATGLRRDALICFPVRLGRWLKYFGGSGAVDLRRLCHPSNESASQPHRRKDACPSLNRSKCSIRSLFSGAPSAFHLPAAKPRSTCHGRIHTGIAEAMNWAGVTAGRATTSESKPCRLPRVWFNSSTD